MVELRHVMGMPVRVEVRDARPVDSEPAFRWLRHVDALFSPYREDSVISRLDRGERAGHPLVTEVQPRRSRWGRRARRGPRASTATRR